MHNIYSVPGYSVKHRPIYTLYPHNQIFALKTSQLAGRPTCAGWRVQVMTKVTQADGRGRFKSQTSLNPGLIDDPDMKNGCLQEPCSPGIP